MTPITVAVAALCVASLLAVLAGRAGDGTESPFDAAIRPSVESTAVEPRPSLVAARRVIVNATGPRSLHRRVRPVLIELAEARLRDRHGFGLDDTRAAAVVGEPLWSIVRPGARAPDHDDPGLTPAQMSAVLAQLEEL